MGWGVKNAPSPSKEVESRQHAGLYPGQIPNLDQNFIRAKATFKKTRRNAGNNMFSSNEAHIGSRLK